MTVTTAVGLAGHAMVHFRPLASRQVMHFDQSAKTAKVNRAVPTVHYWESQAAHFAVPSTTVMNFDRSVKMARANQVVLAVHCWESWEASLAHFAAPSTMVMNFDRSAMMARANQVVLAVHCQELHPAHSVAPSTTVATAHRVNRVPRNL
jgi:uncharacterized protein YbaA (DUF1428 family)